MSLTITPVDVFRACLIANGLKDPEAGACGMLANSPPDERAYCSAIADALNVVLANVCAEEVAVQEGDPAPQPTGWIIGDSAGTKWRMWDRGCVGWTALREQATRYTRRCDAEAVHAEDEGAWTVQPYGEPT